MLGGLNKKMGKLHVAAVFIVVVYFLILHFLPQLGENIFVILIAFVITDLASRIFVQRKKGAIRIPIVDSTKHQKQGHGFIAYVSMILITSIISAWLANYIFMNYLPSYHGDILTELAISIVLMLLVLRSWNNFRKKQ